jgi:hypothetical protein
LGSRYLFRAALGGLWATIDDNNSHCVVLPGRSIFLVFRPGARKTDNHQKKCKTHLDDTTRRLLPRSIQGVGDRKGRGWTFYITTVVLARLFAP